MRFTSKDMIDAAMAAAAAQAAAEARGRRDAADLAELSNVALEGHINGMFARDVDDAEVEAVDDEVDRRGLAAYENPVEVITLIPRELLDGDG